MLDELTVSFIVLAGVLLSHISPFIRKLLSEGLLKKFLSQLKVYDRTFGSKPFSDYVVF